MTDPRPPQEAATHAPAMDVERFARFHERSGVPRHLKELEQSQNFPAVRLREMQLERLRKLVVHAYAHCPFYRKRFDEAGFNPRRVQTLSDLSVLPVLTKRDIQTHLETLRAANLGKKDLGRSQG